MIAVKRFILRVADASTGPAPASTPLPCAWSDAAAVRALLVGEDAAAGDANDAEEAEEAEGAGHAAGARAMLLRVDVATWQRENGR